MHWVNWTWSCCVLLTIIAGFPRATASLLNNDNRQTCLRDGKALKVVLCTKFCPLCDKHVIASARGQLRINFTCIFKFSKLLSSLRDSGNFVKTLKILVKFILNCPQAHAITYTKCYYDQIFTSWFFGVSHRILW